MDGRALADPQSGQLPNLILEWRKAALEKSVCVREEAFPGIAGSWSRNLIDSPENHTEKNSKCGNSN